MHTIPLDAATIGTTDSPVTDARDEAELPVLEHTIAPRVSGVAGFERTITAEFREAFLPSRRHRNPQRRTRTIVVRVQVAHVSGEDAPVAILDHTRPVWSQAVTPAPFTYRWWDGHLYLPWGTQSSHDQPAPCPVGGERFPAAETRRRPSSDVTELPTLLRHLALEHERLLVVDGGLWELVPEPMYVLERTTTRPNGSSSDEHHTFTVAVPHGGNFEQSRDIWPATGWEAMLSEARARGGEHCTVSVPEVAPLEVLIAEAVRLVVPVREAEAVVRAREGYVSAVASYQTWLATHAERYRYGWHAPDSAAEADQIEAHEAQLWAAVLTTRATLAGLGGDVTGAHGALRPYEARGTDSGWTPERTTR